MSITRISPRILWGALLLVALSVTLLPSALPAQSGSCVAYDRHYEPRPCTFMERYGECLYTALHSYYDCLDRGGFFNDAGCFIAAQVDLTACHMSMPFELMGPILR